MSFFQPWAVWFLAGLPVIVALYLLRHQRRSLTVSTHLFWRRLLEEHSRRAFFQRLRNVLSLLLHLLIFALIVAALARPAWQAVQAGTSTVIILDMRGRMAAMGKDGQPRFAQARTLALAEARHVGGTNEAALITLGVNASVAVPFTKDSRDLTTVIEPLQVSEGGAPVTTALKLADTLLAARMGKKRIVLVSDREPPSRPTSPLTLRGVGAPLDNLAITRFATRPLPTSPGMNDVLVEVANFSRNPATTDLEIAVDGRTLEVRPMRLAAGEHRSELLQGIPSPGRAGLGWLTATLSQGGALAWDDTARAVLPKGRIQRVLLVSRGNHFLEKFLAVDLSVKFQLLAPEAWDVALATKFEAVIFDGVMPGVHTLADIEQEGGNRLYLGTTPFDTQEALVQPLVTRVDATHPAVRGVSLHNVTIAKTRKQALPQRQGWQFSTPLESFDTPLLVTGVRGSQRIVALGFDVMESDLPLRVAFPLLMNHSLHWLAGHSVDAAPGYGLGETLIGSGQERIVPVAYQTPPRTLDEARADALEAIAAGFYAMVDGESVRWVAVNAFHEEESDLRRGAVEIERVPTVATGVSAFIFSLAPWQWLAVVALLLFTLEWWLFHRRHTE